MQKCKALEEQEDPSVLSRDDMQIGDNYSFLKKEFEKPGDEGYRTTREGGHCGQGTGQGRQLPGEGDQMTHSTILTCYAGFF